MNDEQAPAHGAGARFGLRAALIALIAVGAALAVLVVVPLSGDDPKPQTPAPARSMAAADPKCIEAWNANATQLELSRHQTTEHQTRKAWMLVLGFDG